MKMDGQAVGLGVEGWQGSHGWHGSLSEPGAVENINREELRSSSALRLRRAEM